MIYKPDDILMVAKVNKGQLLSDIYKYVPEYLEWLIVNHHSFCLDIDLFLKLPRPTPFYKDFRYFIKMNDFREKYIRKMNATASYLGVREQDLLKKITEDVKLKVEEHFNIKGVYPNQNVQYALNIIKVVGFEPDSFPFIFSNKAIEINNKKAKNYKEEDFERTSRHELSYEEYGDAYGYDDDTINEAFDGDPENYWNID